MFPRDLEAGNSPSDGLISILTTSDDRDSILIEMDSSVSFASEALDSQSVEVGRRIIELIWNLEDGTSQVELHSRSDSALPVAMSRTDWRFVVEGLERGAAAYRELGSTEPRIQSDDDEYLARAQLMESLVRAILRAIE